MVARLYGKVLQS